MISLRGNTRGMVVFPVPFRYRLRLNFGMRIGTITKKGVFGVVLNFDERKGRYARTEFLDLGVYTSSPKMKRAKGGRDSSKANTWHTKLRQVPWVVEYSMPNPKKPKKGPAGSALLSTTFDAGGDEELTNRLGLPGTSFNRGLIGFHWTTAKFQLLNLKICGILDKELAVKMLRKKLGIKAPKKTAKKTRNKTSANPGKSPPDVPATTSAGNTDPKKTEPITQF